MPSWLTQWWSHLQALQLLQLKNKLQGKAVTHSEKLEWWIILMVDCVTILLYISLKWLHNPPLK